MSRYGDYPRNVKSASGGVEQLRSRWIEVDADTRRGYTRDPRDTGTIVGHVLQVKNAPLSNSRTNGDYKPGPKGTAPSHDVKVCERYQCWYNERTGIQIKFDPDGGITGWYFDSGLEYFAMLGVGGTVDDTTAGWTRQANLPHDKGIPCVWREVEQWRRGQTVEPVGLRTTTGMNGFQSMVLTLIPEVKYIYIPPPRDPTPPPPPKDVRIVDVEKWAHTRVPINGADRYQKRAVVTQGGYEGKFNFSIREDFDVQGGYTIRGMQPLIAFGGQEWEGGQNWQALNVAKHCTLDCKETHSAVPGSYGPIRSAQTGKTYTGAYMHPGLYGRRG